MPMGDVVVIRGWRPSTSTTDGRIETKRSEWFSVQLTEQVAPCTFYRCVPYRAISALELMATAVSLQVFGVPAAKDAEAHGVGGVVLSTGTDSQVASRTVDKGIARTFLMCCIAMEVAAVQERHNMWLYSRGTPLDWNTEADDLTNGRFSAFSPGLRIAVDVERLPWLVLPGLLKTGLDWHRRRADKLPRQEGQARDPRRKPIKERDPWCGERGRG